MITEVGPIDDHFVDPPLLLSTAESSGLRRELAQPSSEERVLQRMCAALMGPELEQGDRGWGLFDLLERPVAHDPQPGLGWPRFIRHGYAFPAVRLLSDLDDQTQPVTYAPASLAQLILEVAASDAIESSLRDVDVELRWGPFWCARPGCTKLFVSERLQRDERACFSCSGYRSLLFSQYCSHACFLADMGKMSGHLVADPVMT